MSNICRKSLIAVSLAMITTQAHSAGYQVSEHSASGLGRAFSGEAAVADNAAVLSRNPAAMMLFDARSISVAGSLIDPNVDVEDIGQTNQSAKDIAPFAFIPASYYISPIDEHWAWGVGLFTTYGVATDYPDNFAYGKSAGDTSLVTVTLNPNIAYRVNENFSVGAGLSLSYAKAELNRHVNGLFGPTNPSLGNSGDKLITMEGTTTGWGWNIGALYELDSDNRWGVTYRSETTLDFDGDFTDHQGLTTGNKGVTVGASLEAVMPATAEFSGFHQLNTQWAVHYSVLWTDWSEFTELRATSSQCTASGNVCLLKEEKYEDALRWSVGGTYNLNADWILRAGFAYDEQAGKATLSIPDTDRYWYTAGATWNFDTHWTFDAGVAYVDSQTSTFEEDNSTFRSSGNALIYSAQANYRF